MKKNLLFPLLSVMIPLVLAPQALSATWTFMVYLDGDNNLEDAGIDDFLEMAAVGSTSDLNIIVEFDRIDGEATDYGDWTTTKRFRVTKDMTPTAANQIADIGEANMGDPATLVSFVSWAVANYPADNYALVLWNHGGGWRRRAGKEDEIFKAVCWDDTNGGDCLYMKEVKAALETIGTRIQVLGFDACLMGMIEVAYQVKDRADVMVGSEASEPGDGWPYDTLLADLLANLSWTPAQFASDIVDRYYQSYGNDETQSAIDLSALPALAAAVNGFAQALIDHWDDDHGSVISAAETVKSNVDAAVINDRHGSGWPGASGLAIYFPSGSGSFDSDYNGTVIDFPAATAWEEFLAAYYASMGSSWIAEKRATAQEFDYPEHIDLYHFCELLGTIPGQYYTQSLAANEFAGGGSGRNWKADEESWPYTLPFAFPFFGSAYSTVNVHSNGYLDFASDEPEFSGSLSDLAANVRIAPLWIDLTTQNAGEDIYISEFSDRVVIRWAAELYTSGLPVNLEVALHSDGRIKFNYGTGNLDLVQWGDPPTIGISRGDGTNYYASAYNGQTNLQSVPTEIYTPISLSPSGRADGDYDGDGRDDIAIFRPSSGLWSVRGVTRCNFGSAGDLPVPGDYSGNGKTDIGIFRAAGGRWAIRGFTTIYLGLTGDNPVPGDYNGDGRREAGIFRDSSGLWVIGAVTRLNFGLAGDRPAPGDYDGNGTRDIACFRPSTGAWRIRNQGTFYLGNSSDTPVGGDYNGDGIAEPAVFRSGSSLWAVMNSTRVSFGSAVDYPVPADYDGDRADEIGIFRPGSGLWSVKDLTRAYLGGAADLPATR